jgi:hypothetical protein
MTFFGCFFCCLENVRALQPLFEVWHLCINLESLKPIYEANLTPFNPYGGLLFRWRSDHYTNSPTR